MLRSTNFYLARKIDRNALCKTVAKQLKHQSSKESLTLEKGASANNYAPLPVMFHTAKGVVVTNPEGKHYYDFLSGYGAVSHGHVHPRIVKVATEQLQKCTLSSRAFHSTMFGIYADFMTKFFGYDRVLPMNTGAEGVETALKLARKWGYTKKGIAKDKAIIVCCTSNFHGRTFGAIAMSDDPSAYADYGPHLPGFIRVPYGDADALAKVFKQHGKNVAGFIAEPIQGEAGVVIPPKGYFSKVRKLCTTNNVLMICDEVQSGVGRSGKMLAIEHEKVRPDVVILAKALGAGIMPVAAVLADKKIMEVFTPGTHGSTFGGNPLACAVAIESLRVMHEEKLVENSEAMGLVLNKALSAYKKQYPKLITGVRSRGLFAAMDFAPELDNGKAATEFMHLLMNHGVLAKTTHGTTIRMSPPLVINKGQMLECINRIGNALAELDAKYKK